MTKEKMKTATITFTEVEANELIRMIDIAVKSQGLAIAENGIVLGRKLKQHFNQPEKPAEKPVKKKGGK